MEIAYQVGQVVMRGTLDLQQQWQDQLEQFRAARDAGFDTYCWAQNEASFADVVQSRHLLRHVYRIKR